MIRSARWLCLGLLAACGGASAEAPLTVPVGTTRDQVAGDLRRHQYCEGKAHALADYDIINIKTSAR